MSREHNEVKRRILANPELRETYCRELQTQRRARIEHERQEAERESEKEARLDALYARLGVPRPAPEDSKLLRPVSALIEDQIANAATRDEMRVALLWQIKKGTPRGGCL